MPGGIKIPDAEQLDAGRQQLLLGGEQGRQFDVAGVQLDLDDRLLDDLQLDETEIFDGEGNGVIIGRGIAQHREEFFGIRQHPTAVRGDQHRQPIHRSLPRTPIACRSVGVCASSLGQRQ